jgi:3-keto-L-gulonate-6-phosphate decarboxylase
VVADLLGVTERHARARELARLGVDYIGVHTGVDEQAGGADPLAALAEIRGAVGTPVVVAGGISLGNVAEILAFDPAIVVVGSHITGVADPLAAACAFRAALDRASVADAE